MIGTAYVLRLTPFAAAAVVMAGLASATYPQDGALAQDAMTGPPAMMIKRLCDDQPAIFSAHMAFIETKIGLTAEQDAAWKTFVSAAKAAEAMMPNPCTVPPPPMSDAIALRAELDEAFEAGYKAHKIIGAAIDALSAKLTPDHQRKLIEATLPGPIGIPPGPMMGGPMMGPHGMPL